MSNPLISPELHKIADSFRWNAENALRDSSLFYAKLASRVADDPEMLALAAHAQPHQPPMNLLFGAAHYLLLGGIDDPLALFFADLVRKPNTHDDPYPIFRIFCLEHSAQMVELISTRRVQTNEVARCALLLPAFEWIARRVGQPFALVEVGSSAGLNLNWDRYAYAYGEGVMCGDMESPVRLTCELRGERKPVLPETLPRIFSRVGIDLNPNDVFDDDAMLWLRALVWPEQLDRAERLQRAIELARQFPPRVLQGDALTLTPHVLREIPSDVPSVLFHSFVLNQIPVAARKAYAVLLREQSRGRMVFDVAIEPDVWPARLTLTTWRDDREKQETLAICDHHGRWLEWIYDDDASV